ncbi:MAG: DEAD/DEAH box helicase, partial [Filifactor alocis]|nr:DEAD/DEAH box helicase [Filifactor alocis]
MKFKEFNLREEHISALKDMYISSPTEIQSKVIPLMRKGRDLLVQAQTGTGKTLSFLIPILENFSPEEKENCALIIVPTRELSNQISSVLGYFQKHREFHVVNACGGHSIHSQQKALERKSNIIVGTPGRLLDLLRRGSINFKYLSTVVIDEADQIIAFGFLDDLNILMRKLPEKKQVCMFSATISNEVRKISTSFLKNSLKIQTSAEEVVLDNIKQVVVRTTDPRRLSSLFHALDATNPFMCMIFCNSKKSAEELYRHFIEKKYSSFDLLHGDMSQSKREKVIKDFKDLKTQYLITIDLSARGIDIEGITHVFNYEIPRDIEYYIHRIGRTGRMNREGYAVSFVT